MQKTNLATEVVDHAKLILQGMLHGIPPKHLTLDTMQEYIEKAFEVAQAFDTALHAPDSPPGSDSKIVP